MKISELPPGLKELAELRRANCRDIRFDGQDDYLCDAFLWDGAYEGISFWESIESGNFTPFYNCKVVNFKLKEK